MNDEKTREIHESVSSAYTEALESSRKGTGGSCCAPSSGCCTPPVGTAAKTAGYTTEELSRYSEASVSSFGCGNPLAFEGVEPGQVVLDLGSGAGFDLLIASAKVGPEGRVIGVDMTDAMIEAARGNAAKAGATNVEVRKGTIEQLPVEDGSVDWVISNCVINLSPEKDRGSRRPDPPAGRGLQRVHRRGDLRERVHRRPHRRGALRGRGHRALRLRGRAAARDGRRGQPRHRLCRDRSRRRHRGDHREGLEREVPREQVTDQSM